MLSSHPFDDFAQTPFSLPTVLFGGGDACQGPPSVIDWGIGEKRVRMCEEETPSSARVVVLVFCCLLQCSLSAPSHSFSDSSYCWIGYKNATKEDLGLMIREVEKFSQ